MPRNRAPSIWLRRAVAGFCLLVPTALFAGDVVLKNGMVLTGSTAPLTALPTGPTNPANVPTVVYPILMISNDLAQYFVPARQVESEDRGADIQRLELFKLDQPTMVRTKAVGSLGGFIDVKQWDDFGRRGLTLNTGSGPLPVIQGITQLTSDYVRIEGLNVFWRTGMATSSLPPDRIEAILRKSIKPNNPDERLKIVRFYIQAQQFDAAKAELDRIKDDFPELAERCAEAALNLTQRRSQMILDELKLRQESGQYRLAYHYARDFPTENVSASILKDAREFLQAFETRREQAEKAITLLGELQGALTDSALSAEVAPIRAEIAERLHPDNLERLDAFLKLSGDPNLPAADKLALALSGWVVGSSNAVTDLRQALNLWRARFHVRQYLRTARDATAERNRALDQISKVEDIGPKTIAQMLPLLPPFLDTTDVTPGLPGRVLVTPPNAELTIAYSVMLPPEYSPTRSYPLILALHHAGKDANSEIAFWGGTAEQPGQAQRHGHIVIAPEYLPEGARTYDYTAETQRVILESLFDARRRFNVDSDRIFLAGHGTGGDAVFDLGMAHPDLFAGAIPMGGVADRICKYIYPNAKTLPWFVIVGELDRGAIASNPVNVSRMLVQGYDVIYAQHLGAGPDSFYSEIHRLFNWMSRLRRKTYEKGEQIEFLSLRNCDTTTHWVSFGALPESILKMDWNNPKGGRVIPMKVRAKINEGNVLLVDSRGITGHTVWLSPEFVDFDKRLSVQFNGKPKSNDFPKPDIGVMLEDFHRRADRQRLYWAAVSF